MESKDLFNLLINDIGFNLACKGYLKYGDDFWGDDYHFAYNYLRDKHNLPKLNRADAFNTPLDAQIDDPYFTVCKAIKEVHKRLKGESNS